MNLTIPRKNLNIKNILSGGNFPSDVISKINLDNINKKSYIIENKSTDQYIFKFSDDNTEHKELKEYKYLKNPPQYLGKGGLTAVYKIFTPESNSIIPEKYKDELILRIFENYEYKSDKPYFMKQEFNIGEIDINNDENTKLINMWMKHKQLFPENIIDFFMYGEISLNDTYLGFYTITRTYIDIKKIDNLELINKIEYFRNMLIFLQKLNINGYTYRDLKYENIGAELIDGNYKFIVLDYDKYTILNRDDIIDLERKYINNGYNYFIVGTYSPYYIYSTTINEFSYIYLFAGGLLDIITIIFYKNLKLNTNFAELYKKTISCINTFRVNIKDISILYDNYNIYQKNKLRQQSYKLQIDLKKKELITFYQLYGQKLIELIDKTKYENIKIFTDKLIFIIGQIIKSCIQFDFNTVKELCNLDKFISILSEIIIDFNTQKGGYYQKYIKYKTKYLQIIKY